MNVCTQDLLKLAEHAGAIVFLDIESTSLKSDYGSVLCVSLKPFGKRPVTFKVTKPGQDKQLVCAVRDWLEQHAAVVVTFYGARFDWRFLETRLLFHHCRPLPRLIHIDLWRFAKARLNTARRSQAHLLRFLGTVEEKMDVDPEQWNRVLANPAREIKVMVRRCESDVVGLEAMFRRVRHLLN